MGTNSLSSQALLNRESPVPLYHQLLEIFHEYLVNGTWKAGDWIPSESELAREFDVSEITVRQGLLTLSREGRLIRQRGKGTRVADIVQASPLFEFTNSREPFWGFQNMTVRVIETGSALEKNIPPNPLGKNGVFYIRRLCSMENNPAIFQTMFVASEIAEQIDSADWQNPRLWKVLPPFFKNLTQTKETVEAISLSSYEAEVLGEKEGKMALLVERTLIVGETPIFFERIISRFGSLTFLTHFSPA